ncbi:MAG: hypothetical protein AAFY74_13915 [Pseudomonadota bacterium]
MPVRSVATAAMLILITMSAAAADGKFMYISIRDDKPKVKVTNLVGGYSEAEIMRQVAYHCAGKTGALALDGRPRKKRGRVFQKYTTTCEGGPNPKVLETSILAVEIEAVSGGETMFEYTYSDKGQIAYARVVR